MEIAKMSVPPIFQRTELMLGAEVFAAIRNAKVAIVGLGGVGGWCAESLARSGIGELALIDSDCVAATNVNRQVMADSTSVGRVKVEVLAERLRAINPEIRLETHQRIYSAENAAEFRLERFDYVVDAIDSLAEKAELIRQALAIPTVTLFASMGAALKMDPSRIRSTVFRKVEGDGLARALRQKFKKSGGMPERQFVCVWSDERRENRGTARTEAAAAGSLCDWNAAKARINGTVAHTTAIFGFTLAGLVLQDLERRVVNG